VHFSLICYKIAAQNHFQSMGYNNFLMAGIVLVLSMHSAVDIDNFGDNFVGASSVESWKNQSANQVKNNKASFP
jgi:hypothetical protein